MIKQVIVIRKDLNMRKGKMVSQGAHASMKVFFDRMNKKNTMSQLVSYEFVATKQMIDWIDGNFKKIVVSVDSEIELLNYQFLAEEAGIPNALIEDNGLTEFNGVKTKTALAIGPDDSEKIDAITKNLKLL